MREYRYSIEARWRVESVSPEELGQRFLAVLDATSGAAPEAGEWQLGKPPYLGEYLTIGEANSALSSWVEENVSAVEGTPDPEDGYQLMALRMTVPTSKILSLIGIIGGRLGDTIRFEVGSAISASDLETVTYNLFRTTLLALVRHLPPVWAEATLFVRELPSPSLSKNTASNSLSRYSRPWLGYICAPLAKGLVPPVGVPCERTTDGGLLMVAAEERLDPFNPVHMRRSQAIAATMVAQVGNPPRPGYWPIDEEWPPTPEALARRGPPST